MAGILQAKKAGYGLNRWNFQPVDKFLVSAVMHGNYLYYPPLPQHFLYFWPLPHIQGALRPILGGKVILVFQK